MLFEDNNNNLKYDRDEPAGYWANPDDVKLPATGKIITDLIISKKTKIPSGYSSDINNIDGALGDTFIIKTGEIADINNKMFSADSGRKGLWTPLTFLEENGLGIYFLEKYDPEKIPVLFVYGIGGFPQNWKHFFDKIDRSRYQPWFYYYPSGMRIAKAGSALDVIVNELHTKYKFDTMFLVGHSLGGLVSREYIKKYISVHRKNYLKLFISISTPWAGDKDAEWAKHAPAMIPCWKDLSPDSPLIKNSSAEDIGANIPYYLFFSYHGDRKPFRKNNDNIVYLSSQFEFDMQKRAEKIFGFDLSHTEILKDQQVIATCNAIFAEHDSRKRDVKKAEKKSSFFDFLYNN